MGFRPAGRRHNRRCSVKAPVTTAALPSRRVALASLAGFGAALALPAVTRAEPAAQPDIAALWHAYLVTLGASTVAQKAYADAEAKLPQWAAYGPRYINHKGEPCGEMSSWPAIQDAEAASEPGCFRLVRFGPDEIRNRTMNPARLDKSMAEHEARMSARAAEYDALGLPTLGEADEDAANAVFDRQQAIEALPSTTLDVVAAKAIVYAVAMEGVEDTAETSECLALLAIVLKGLLPHLTGELAEDAAEIVHNPTRPLKAMRASRGIVVTA